MSTKKPNKKILKKLPDFKSSHEEAVFWDTHSLADYYDFSKGRSGGFILDNDVKKGKSVTIRLQEDLIDKVKKMASNVGLSTSSFLRMWIIEKAASS